MTSKIMVLYLNVALSIIYIYKMKEKSTKSLPKPKINTKLMAGPKRNVLEFGSCCAGLILLFGRNI